MGKPKFCIHCVHWEKVVKPGDEFGICHDVGVSMNVALDGNTNLGEDGTFWTGAYFGCVYWREKPNEIVNFNRGIDPDTGEIL
jgi:hypothetical protein